MILVRVILGISLLLSCGSRPAPSTQASPERELVTDTTITILDNISFDEGATLAEHAHETLEGLASTLKGNPGIELLAIQASASEEELAERRSQVIIDFLVALEISTDRLTNQPRVSQDETVEFEILRRGSDDAQ